MNSPRVSIIMRTKDRPLFLGRAIDSVLAQSFGDWQLVLVNDGGAKEPIQEILNSRRAAIGGRLVELHHPQALGRWVSCNAGIRAASGEFITILDDDDTWQPNFLQTMLAFMEKAPAFWAGASCLVDLIFEAVEGSNIVFLERRPQDPGLKAFDFNAIMSHGALTNHSFVYRRSVWEELGGYRDDFPVVGDREFWVRLLLKYDIFLIRESLANYHIRLEKSALDRNLQNSTQNNLHENYTALLQNERIRQEAKDGTLSLGSYYLLRNLIEPYLREQNVQFFQIKEHLRHQDPVYWLRRLNEHCRQSTKRCRALLKCKLGF